jgi:hypothetical protein
MGVWWNTGLCPPLFHEIGQGAALFPRRTLPERTAFGKLLEAQQKRLFSFKESADYLVGANLVCFGPVAQHQTVPERSDGNRPDFVHITDRFPA